MDKYQNIINNIDAVLEFSFFPSHSHSLRQLRTWYALSHLKWASPKLASHYSHFLLVQLVLLLLSTSVFFFLFFPFSLMLSISLSTKPDVYHIVFFFVSMYFFCWIEFFWSFARISYLDVRHHHHHKIKWHSNSIRRNRLDSVYLSFLFPTTWPKCRNRNISKQWTF